MRKRTETCVKRADVRSRTAFGKHARQSVRCTHRWFGMGLVQQDLRMRSPRTTCRAQRSGKVLGRKSSSFCTDLHFVLYKDVTCRLQYVVYVSYHCRITGTNCDLTNSTADCVVHCELMLFTPMSLVCCCNGRLRRVFLLQSGETFFRRRLRVVHRTWVRRGQSSSV